ncbi:MAG: triose-phosphate isomerase [Chloroflexi bacterium]|nr:triose-phosphate isomerase [Chloroflexota bacterium]
MAWTASLVRTPLIVGNWKMNTTLSDAVTLMQALLPRVADLNTIELVVCPPFPWIVDLRRMVAQSSISVGAQNIHTQDGGAYTGEVSARMLADVCNYVLVGQYERRILFADKDAIVRQKMLVALKRGLRPILCVGETADQLDEGSGAYVLTAQLESALEEAEVSSSLVVAYEPVWTTMGRVAPPPLSYVGEMCGIVRDTVRDLQGGELAESIRVIYGGQVSPRNVQEIAADERIDGVLAGSASVNADNFAALARAFSERKSPGI